MIYRCIWNSLLHIHQIGLGGKDDDGAMERGGEDHATQHVDYTNKVHIKCFFQTCESLYFFPFVC
jgi:hypothetical protein